MTPDDEHVDCEQAAFATLPVDDLCAEWQQLDGFKQFLTAVGKRRRRTQVLCKVRVGQPWGPNNCEWVSAVEAQNFADPNVPKLTFRGVTAGASRWARWLRLSPSIVYARLRANMPAAHALYHGNLIILRNNAVRALVDTGAPVAVRLARNEPRLFTCTKADMDAVDALRLLLRKDDAC